jgi:chemotaxis protein methyltransferase CheR
MSAAAPLTMPEAISDGDFRRYQRLLREHAGIHLNESKRALLIGRLAKRLRELGMSGYGAYFERVMNDPAERVRMLDLLVTNETSFFREPAQFRYLESTLIPGWIDAAADGARRASLRIWSAGCATGEEPYSLAMLLGSRLEGWRIDILASDISTTVLRQAEEAVWPIAKAAAIPDELLRRYMLRGVGPRAGVMKAAPEIRSLIQFRRINLHQPADSPTGTFDLVLCRNVLIYFDEEARRHALRRLIAACAPGAHLLVGHAETLQGCEGVRPAAPTIWRRSA